VAGSTTVVVQQSALARSAGIATDTHIGGLVLGVDPHNASTPNGGPDFDVDPRNADTPNGGPGFDVDPRNADTPSTGRSSMSIPAMQIPLAPGGLRCRFPHSAHR